MWWSIVLFWRKCGRLKYISGHLGHRHFIMVIKIVVALVNLSNMWLQFLKSFILVSVWKKNRAGKSIFIMCHFYFIHEPFLCEIFNHLNWIAKVCDVNIIIWNQNHYNITVNSICWIKRIFCFISLFNFTQCSFSCEFLFG